MTGMYHRGLHLATTKQPWHYHDVPDTQVNVRLPTALLDRVYALRDGGIITSKRAAIIKALEAGLKALAKEEKS